MEINSFFDYLDGTNVRLAMVLKNTGTHLQVERHEEIEGRHVSSRHAPNTLHGYDLRRAGFVQDQGVQEQVRSR